MQLSARFKSAEANYNITEKLMEANTTVFSKQFNCKVLIVKFFVVNENAKTLVCSVNGSHRQSVNQLCS